MKAKRPWPMMDRRLSLPAPSPSPTEQVLADCLRTAWAKAEELADKLERAELRILYLETERLYRRAGR